MAERKQLFKSIKYPKLLFRYRPVSTKSLEALRTSGATADSAEAQALVAKLQAHITENYYTCTDEILAGLGRKYVADA